MEASDTVINCQKDCSDSGTTWCFDCGYGPAFDDGCEAQAEITWKAAYEEGLQRRAAGIAHYGLGVKAGRQEVVELLHYDIRREITKDGEIVVFRLISDEWQAKLKEWGL